MELVLFAVMLISIAILAKSASAVVDNASKIANYFRISEVAIGFFLISISTSLPELSVSVISSSMGEGAIAAGNAFGSVIANILLILGIGAFFYGLKIKKEDEKDIALVLLITTIISIYIIFITSIRKDALGVFEGAFLLLVYGAYVVYIFEVRKKDGEEKVKITKKEALYSFMYFVASVIVVLVSASFVVDSAVKISAEFGLAESFIGATIIAMGTSLPELSICLQAIRKKHYGIALGNATGASMANLTFILGIAAIINPIYLIIPIFVAALLFSILACALLFYASANRGIGKIGGAIFIASYIIYLITIFYLQFSI